MPRKNPPRPPSEPPEPPQSTEPQICEFEGCGRPFYTKGLCQTHHRQRQATGTLKPIRRYRDRSCGNIKFAGLRLTPYCVERIQRIVDARGISVSAALSEILDAWARRQK